MTLLSFGVEWSVTMADVPRTAPEILLATRESAAAARAALERLREDLLRTPGGATPAAGVGGARGCDRAAGGELLAAAADALKALVDQLDVDPTTSTSTSKDTIHGK